MRHISLSIDQSRAFTILFVVKSINLAASFRETHWIADVSLSKAAGSPFGDIRKNSATLVLPLNDPGNFLVITAE